jgi:signal transduction histidine kinase
MRSPAKRSARAALPESPAGTLLQPPEHLQPLMRWILGALDLVVSFGHLQSGAGPDRSPSAIFAAARTHLKTLLPLRTAAFLTVDDERPDFVMTDCEPETDRAWLQAEIDAHVAAGGFAWALRCNRPVVLPSRGTGDQLVLHALQAGARTVGMFVGVLADADASLDEASSNLLSLILLNTAQVLLGSERSRDLEQMVAERTRVLEETYEELAQAHAQLAHTAKMEAVGRLAAGIAHDFNNLLQVIQGHSELSLLRLPAGDPLARSVESIRETAYRAGDLTRRLLIFSRKQDLQATTLDLNGLLEGIGDLLRRLIGEHIQLDTLCARGLGAVEADPAQLEQVIMNLAVNARDAMPGGGRLTLATANVHLDDEGARRLGLQPDRHVQLTVSDTGCGMDAETRERAFEPFFTTKGAGEGTGLGLATVYGIVRQSGGAVTLDSEPGRGTRVTVYLPRVDKRPEPAPSARDTSQAPRGGETILLAEDDDAVRGLAREVLEAHGYVVIEARDGTEALGLVHARRDPIDLLLTDVVMPGLGGTALAQRLTAARPATAVLFMSGYIDGGLPQAGPAAGSPLLTKPFTTVGLTRKVRQVLDETRATSRATETAAR